MRDPQFDYKHHKCDTFGHSCCDVHHNNRMCAQNGEANNSHRDILGIGIRMSKAFFQHFNCFKVFEN